MDSVIEPPNPSVAESDNPPTLVAESEKGKSSVDNQTNTRMSTESVEDKTAMPVLQPNVTVDSSSGTRSKSGRIRKPARNFTSDEYVVPNLVKKRIPNNSRPGTGTSPVKPGISTASSSTSTSTQSGPSSSEIEAIRTALEQRLLKSAANNNDSPFPFILTVCSKDPDLIQSTTVGEIHALVKQCYKNWIKGPYRLKEDEIKFVQQCIVKADSALILMKDWNILAEALKDRSFRMRKRFAKTHRLSKVVKQRKEHMVKAVTKSFLELGNKLVANKQLVNSDEEMDSDEIDDVEEAIDDLDDDPSYPSPPRVSTRSTRESVTRGRNSKTSSVVNDADMDLSLGSGIDDFTGDDLKEELFDDLESALVNETKDKGSNDNSMVAALHATLQKDGGPEFDPSQYEPPALEKDNTMFALDDMEGAENSCNFFENMKEPSFENAETPTGLTDEAFAELEQRVVDEDMKQEADQFYDDAFPENTDPEASGSRRFGDDKFDVGALEIEESSGNVRLNSGSRGDFASPGITMISTKTALMCALKISEDFLPSSHEKYLDRLEETDKYHHNDLDDIRRKFNMRPSAYASKRKMKLNVDMESNKRQKVALKVINGPDKPKPLPYLRSAYAKCRKFMEDETTVIEKLGNNKILAAGRVIDIEYEKYLKEADVEIPFDDTSGPMPSLPPPTVSNCHAPSCRLGCICSSISEDMPPRKHCGRPRCFFECTCQNILLNSSDDGDIRSRLRPRVSLLNWRAESTEKEKEPMTSYRQMERGTHFIRMRRNAAQPERLRREFVLDGKVVDRSATKVTKERLRTKALLQSSHRRIMAKPADGHRFVRIVPATNKHDQPKVKVNVEQMKKKCTPLTVDVEHLDIKVSEKKLPNIIATPVKRRITPERPVIPRITIKDLEEMKSIIQEMTEDFQLLITDDKVAFFSWSKALRHPKVLMYQVKQGDELAAPWLYLPIPPQGHSWLCHQLKSSFEKTDYVYIPEIKCSLSSQALKVSMNTATLKKKTVVFDIKTCENPSGSVPGKIYFFPDLPKVLVCGPFKNDQTHVNPRDITNADRISSRLQQLEKLKLKKKFGDGHSWKRFASAPTIFPIKNRQDNETVLSAEESQRLFQQLYSSFITPGPCQLSNNGGTGTGGEQIFKQPLPLNQTVSFDWTKAVKFVGLNTASQQGLTLTEIITL